MKSNRKILLQTAVVKLAQRRVCVFLSLMITVAVLLSGCQSITGYRKEADKAASDIIRQQREALGKVEDFTIIRPSDILRRRLLEEQDLPYSGPASLGTDKLEAIEHWPEDGYPGAVQSLSQIVMTEPNMPVRLTLLQALQVGARNSFEYQTRKEDIFRKALDLDLERNDFRNTFTGQVESILDNDTTGNRVESNAKTTGDFSLSRKLQSGAVLTTAIAIDMANLLTLGGASSFGIVGSASVSIPLLRGSGRHIVIEDMTQAQRDVVYSISTFERFKKTFAVNIATDYLLVLRQIDVVKNNEENYRGLIASARRARRRADAGRQTEVEVDQAVQDELRARNQWISAIETYNRRIDSFKSSLSLPPDASIELDRSELDQLSLRAEKLFAVIKEQEEASSEKDIVSDDTVIELIPPSMENAGKFEIDETKAIKLGLGNRLDLLTAEGRVYDAQRAVIIAADRLGAELTFDGSGRFGLPRGGSSGTSDNSKIRFDKGFYTAGLNIDLGLERTSERNAYRKSYIDMEEAVREVQILEDRIKLNIRDKLRDLMETRETMGIQSSSVTLAQKRVNMTNMYIEAGRAQIRDLLEAQESLLGTQNALIAAVVNYRVAELELQSEMGVLKVDEKGLWQEYSPEETK